MKNRILLLTIFLFIFVPFSYSEEWDDFADLDRAWDGQKTITNQEFEEVMDALQEKQKKKEDKQRKKLIKKIGGGGTSLHPGMDPDKNFGENQKIKTGEEGILVNIPVNLMIDGKTLEKGFYKVVANREKDNKIYVMFYQSQFLKGKVQAEETNDDFEQETLDFAEVIPYNESFIKMIFGSIDFNAYAYIPYKN